MNERDQFIQSQVTPVLMPAERVLHTAYMVKQPGLLWQILLVGGLLLVLMTKAYYAVLTDRRLILIRTKQGLFSPKMVNIGVEQFDVSQMVKCTVSGFANNRSMTFHFRDGSKQTLRISPWNKIVTGTKAFFEQVPQLIGSLQLAAPHKAYGALAPAPQQGYAAPGSPQQGYGAPGSPQQGYGAPGSPQQGYGAPAPQAVGFAPGARVSVAWSDGNRYPATVVQAQGDQVLCAMSDGQQQWIPATHVGPA